ncbi:ClpXP protease specificity-enhancing factor [Marinicella sp. W31]|uniref:ClpXP protease specificity-enhancing factor n=1 Tax=Marinicella sp. W31 TaxID=3023713 RepID=UPI003756C502
MISDENMSSAKPYLIRALHQWIIDNGMTPLVVVQGNHPQLEIPEHLLKDETVVFNISWDAADRLEMSNDYINFQARFSGKSYAVSLPLGLISAIYSRENGKGMMFDVDESVEMTDEKSKTPTSTDSIDSSKSHLKLVD